MLVRVSGFLGVRVLVRGRVPTCADVCGRVRTCLRTCFGACLGAGLIPVLFAHFLLFDHYGQHADNGVGDSVGAHGCGGVNALLINDAL